MRAYRHSPRGEILVRAYRHSPRGEILRTVFVSLERLHAFSPLVSLIFVLLVLLVVFVVFVRGGLSRDSDSLSRRRVVSLRVVRPRKHPQVFPSRGARVAQEIVIDEEPKRLQQTTPIRAHLPRQETLEQRRGCGEPVLDPVPARVRRRLLRSRAFDVRERARVSVFASPPRVMPTRSRRALSRRRGQNRRGQNLTVLPVLLFADRGVPVPIPVPVHTVPVNVPTSAVPVNVPTSAVPVPARFLTPGTLTPGTLVREPTRVALATRPRGPKATPPRGSAPFRSFTALTRVWTSAFRRRRLDVDAGLKRRRSFGAV